MKYKDISEDNKIMLNITGITVGIILLFIGSIMLTQPRVSYKMYGDDLSIAQPSVELARSMGVEVHYVLETDDGYDIVGTKGDKSYIVYVTNDTHSIEYMTPDTVEYFMQVMWYNIKD